MYAWHFTDKQTILPHVREYYFKSGSNIFWIPVFFIFQEQSPSQKFCKKGAFKGALLGLRQFFTTESPLKMMKNAFYFILKAFFLLFQTFVLIFSSCRKRTISLISKYIMSQPRKKTIAIHILPNTSRNKGNLTTKFGQLIKHNMRNIFLEKP